MPGISGMLTTFNGPNYVGPLFEVTPTETPFLSAIGGLTGGRPADATLFTWQTVDLRDADASRQRLEGATAPTAEARTRQNVRNVCEIHQESISISYTKLAAVGQFADTGSSHPYAAGLNGSNPIADEEARQTTWALQQIARDVELGFLTNEMVEPTTNATARKSAGLDSVITTNVVSAGNAPLTEDMILDLMEMVWQEGGISVSETATLICNGGQKRKLSEIFITNKGYQEQTRNVGGVNLTTFETDFGKCNIMLDRFMPTDKIFVVSMDECAPRFLPIPGKGFLFVEELARTGASIEKQIYGEIGLEYGVEFHHGKIADLNTTGS